MKHPFLESFFTPGTGTRYFKYHIDVSKIPTFILTLKYRQGIIYELTLKLHFLFWRNNKPGQTISHPQPPVFGSLPEPYVPDSLLLYAQ